jgi:hypothetical protein
MYSKICRPYLLIAGAIGALIISSGYLYKANRVVQIDVRRILNTRSVTTLTKGTLITWENGVDKQNGYLTLSASLSNGDINPHALPDNPLIAANEHHPEILLHYANNEGKKNQTTFIADSGQLIIKVPHKNYTALYLSLTSAYGASHLQFDLVYKDGTEVKNFVLPDWWKDILDNDPDFSYVVHDMGKWGKRNDMTEKNHHNIDALNIHPDPDRVLEVVKLRKLPGGYLVFWGATGVVK